MIILPTVRGGVFPAFNNLLGRGSYGEVFGPFSRKEILQFLSAFYKGPTIRLRGDHQYVIKKVLPNNGLTCQDLIKKDKTYAGVLGLLTPSERGLFILPIIVGCIGDTMFEIQRFGGKEVYEVLLSGDKIGNPTLFFHRLIQIMTTCMRLVDKGILLTDLKPENMVMMPDGSVSVIDFDTKIMRQTKPFLFTLHQQIIPIQFLNLNPKPTRDAKVERYLSSSTADRDSLIRALNASESIPASTIAKFSIIWCIAHIIHLTLVRSVRGNGGPLFMSAVLSPLIRERLTVPLRTHTGRIRNFIRQYFSPKPKSDGRVRP